MLLRKLYHVKRKLRRASDNGQFTGVRGRDGKA
jgi:hypothetical protein